MALGAVIRGALGLLCVFFAQFFGRSTIRLREGTDRPSKTFVWALRTMVTGAGVTWRSGFDVATIAIFAVAILSFTLGAFLESRPKHNGELHKVMFPSE